MGIDNILAEKADAGALSQQMEQQRRAQAATSGQTQTRRTATPGIRIGRNDLQVALQAVQLAVLLLILTKL